MKRTLKKESKRITGLMGFFRAYGASAVVVIMFYPVMKLVNNTFYAVLATFVILAALSLVYTLITYRKKNKETILRKITDAEWSELINKNAIHYRNEVTYVESKMFLKAHYSQRTNYQLPAAYRKCGFVWFHLSDPNNNREPALSSFLEAHYLEGQPRKYKLIFPIKDLPQERLYLHTSTGYILVMGDLTARGEIETKFKWYNDRVYWKVFVRTIFDLLFGLKFAYFQLIGAYKDAMNNKEKKNSKRLGI